MALPIGHRSSFTLRRDSLSILHPRTMPFHFQWPMRITVDFDVIRSHTFSTDLLPPTPITLVLVHSTTNTIDSALRRSTWSSSTGKSFETDGRRRRRWSSILSSFILAFASALQSSSKGLTTVERRSPRRAVQREGKEREMRRSFRGSFSVRSSTLWLGHWPKMISEVNRRERLEPHDDITDISVILRDALTSDLVLRLDSPLSLRDCAFVCFKERANPARRLVKMKDTRFRGNPIKVSRRISSKNHSFSLSLSVYMAWAMNKGVKNKYKDAWDVDHGCTYIPYTELKDTPNLNALAEDETIDEGSFPLFLKRLFLLSSRDRIDPLAQSSSDDACWSSFTCSTSSSSSDFNTTDLRSSRISSNYCFIPNRPIVSQPNRPFSWLPSEWVDPFKWCHPVHKWFKFNLIPMDNRSKKCNDFLLRPLTRFRWSTLLFLSRCVGRVFPNGQIIHQMPFATVLAATPHHSAEFQVRTSFESNWSSSIASHPSRIVKVHLSLQVSLCLRLDCVLFSFDLCDFLQLSVKISFLPSFSLSSSMRRCASCCKGNCCINASAIFRSYFRNNRYIFNTSDCRTHTLEGNFSRASIWHIASPFPIYRSIDVFPSCRSNCDPIPQRSTLLSDPLHQQEHIFLRRMNNYCVFGILLSHRRLFLPSFSLNQLHRCWINYLLPLINSCRMNPFILDWGHIRLPRVFDQNTDDRIDSKREKNRHSFKRRRRIRTIPIFAVEDIHSTMLSVVVIDRITMRE